VEHEVSTVATDARAADVRDRRRERSRHRGIDDVAASAEDLGADLGSHWMLRRHDGAHGLNRRIASAGGTQQLN
jgi:hypothetical protein